MPVSLVLGLLVCCSALLYGKTFHGEGMVLAIDKQRETATISHREIRGYMPAMAMEFRVSRSGLLESLEPGMRVRFSTRVVGGNPVIDDVKVLRIAPLPGADLIPAPTVQRLHVGDPVPEFELLSQNGAPFHSASLQGHLTLLQFIYTRCPVADVCPRLSANFAYLQKKFGSQIELLSVTLDPQWDRPQRLAEYANRWGADTRHWRFLTGTDEEIRNLASRFGVIYWAEEGALTHSTAIAMIGPDARIIAELDGSSYPVNQLRDLVSRHLSGRESLNEGH
jgi:protein SCO1/2